MPPALLHLLLLLPLLHLLLLLQSPSNLSEKN